MKRPTPVLDKEKKEEFDASKRRQLKIGPSPDGIHIPHHPVHGDLVEGRIILDAMIQPDGELYLRVEGEEYASDQTPVEQPNETQTEQPDEKPTEQPDESKSELHEFV